MSTMREDSRIDYTGEKTVEHLKLGALQRIADASEKMALRYTELIDKASRLERGNKSLYAQIEQQKRTIAALKGQITKLKRKLVPA